MRKVKSFSSFHELKSSDEGIEILKTSDKVSDDEFIAFINALKNASVKNSSKNPKLIER